MSHNHQEDKTAYPAGLKWTKQRKKVYDVLKVSREPLSAAAVYELAGHDGGESYAISTIYRILAAFEEHELVEKTGFTDDGQAIYALKRGGHTHYAVCLDCHKRIPLEKCPFAHMELVQGNGEFTITGHKLELYGYCKDCKTERA